MFPPFLLLALALWFSTAAPSGVNVVDNAETSTSPGGVLNVESTTISASDLLNPAKNTEILSDDDDLPPSPSHDLVTPDPDWSVFTLSDELLDIQESIRVIESIPVQYFWDFHKGQFKFGILGESVEELYPQFVTNSKRKFSIDSPTYNVTSANTDVIFTHLVLVVQHLALKMASVIGSSVEELLAEGDNFALKIIRIANETGVEWRTANEIRTSREVIEIKKQILDAEILRALARDGYRNDTFQFYNTKKVELLEKQHQQLLDAIFASHVRQDAVEAKKQDDLMHLSEVTESKRRDTQISILHHAHTSAIDRLAVEVELGIKAINFRASEEGRVGRENEDISLNIMQAKGESLRKGFEEIVTMLHVKANMLVQDAFDNPFFVFKYILLVVLALSMYIILLETSLAFRSYVSSKVSTPSVLQQAWSRKRSSGQQQHHEHNQHHQHHQEQQQLVLSTESSNRLDSVAQIYEVVQRAGGRGVLPLLLPNVLLVGPPGTGKSMSAEALAERSGFPYVVVCGGDLLAVGGESSSSSSFSSGDTSSSSSAPGRYLREVLHGASAANKGRGFLVILDEVETIITDRGKRKDRLEQELLEEEDEGGDGAGNGDGEKTVSLESRECIHILLNMLRLNSAALGVIITTSLKIQFVDPALLDRMDRVVTLPLPDASLRLTHVVRISKDLLSYYMEDTSSQSHLDILCAHGNIPLTDCKEKTFSDVVGGILREGGGVEVDVAAALLLKEGASTTEPSAPNKTPATPVKRRGRPRKGATTPVATVNDTITDTDPVTATDKQGTDVSVSKTPSRFNLLRCLFCLVTNSEGWSHRELAKVIQNIQSEVIATEECVLTTAEWERQVRFKVASKQTADRD